MTERPDEARLAALRQEWRVLLEELRTRFELQCEAECGNYEVEGFVPWLAQECAARGVTLAEAPPTAALREAIPSLEALVELGTIDGKVRSSRPDSLTTVICINIGFVRAAMRALPDLKQALKEAP